MTFVLLGSNLCLGQISAKVSGMVTDQNGQSLSGATVRLVNKQYITRTNKQGEFQISDVDTGRNMLHVSFIGFMDTVIHFKLISSDLIVPEIRLAPRYFLGDEIVVTASRRVEKITDAPSSIQSITARSLSESAFYNPAELAAKIQGVEFTRSGVDVVTLNARGFNSANNAKILQLTDGRNSMLPGANSIPSGMMNTAIKEDIERIEIALGPNSALYGPNAHNGVINTITKDPRKYEGTTVVLGGGNQSVFSGRLRQAAKINDRWAYKVTGEYTTGKEFEFHDQIYAGGGVYGQAVVIPERIPSYQFKHQRGEAHLYYNLNTNTYMVASYGGSSNDFINVSNLTRNRGIGYKFSYVQARFVSPRLFIQAYESFTNVGTNYGISGYTRDFWNRTHSTITDPSNPQYATAGRLSPDSAEAYALRLGNRFKEQSKRINAETQYNYRFDNLGLYVVSGLSYQRDAPKTYGTTLADADQEIVVTQYGGALQAEKDLPFRFKFVAAVRLDHHSLFGNLFSPKVALTKGLGRGSIRLTYGEAFAAPTILYQRASLLGIVFGNGNGVRYIPNGSSVNDPAAITSTTALRPEHIKTLELGYKGSLTQSLYLDISGYYGNSKNFISPAISVSGRAVSIGAIPISSNTLAVPGTVNGAGILSGAAFSSYFNYGKVASYGLDAGLSLDASRLVSISLKYSWFGSDIHKDNLGNDANRDGYVSLEERSLNAPSNRIYAGLNLHHLMHDRLYVNLGGRWVEKYDFYSGSQIGTAAGEGTRGSVFGGVNPATGQPRYYLKNYDWGALGGFLTFDVSSGIQLNEMLHLGAGINNVFNTRQVEFVASPSIGRLVAVELKVTLPAHKPTRSL